MKTCIPVALGLALAFATLTASAATTLQTDFESPAFSPGPIGGNPGFTPGQGGWGGFNPGSISTDFAHSGTQSLHTIQGASGAMKALDASVSGDYPYGGAFHIGASFDWWVQAWVRVESGGGAQMTLVNGLGGCPLISVSGTGTPYFNGCLAQDTSQPNVASAVLDHWVLFRISHNQSMIGVNGPGLALDIIGADGLPIISSFMGGYSGPGSGDPGHLNLTGGAYWDDVSAGYGIAPAAVPLPGSALLLLSACGALFRRLRARG
jgi:hypothetical protein